MENAQRDLAYDRRITPSLGKLARRRVVVNVAAQHKAARADSGAAADPRLRDSEWTNRTVRVARRVEYRPCRDRRTHRHRQQIRDRVVVDLIMQVQDLRAFELPGLGFLTVDLARVPRAEPLDFHRPGEGAQRPPAASSAAGLAS